MTRDLQLIASTIHPDPGDGSEITAPASLPLYRKRREETGGGEAKGSPPIFHRRSSFRQPKVGADTNQWA